ncbi:hypothetical protein L596_007884 [Steinernema carpocapsae]|uniref:ADP-ribosylation factor-like protein 13B n=1 Tax=Steinernema carpocapsae TaxID=34508 RepID=A0A4U5PBB2_STECR|nr:hypothetical protein L596_007884 [Steinernema carpocapsae]
MGCVCSRGFNDDDDGLSFLCCCCNQKRHKKRRIRDPITVCVIGLDGAGKTTIIKALRNESPEWVQQTHGFCREEFALDKQKIVAYDLGGDARIRGIWSTYFAECYAVVFVIDGSNHVRISEANEELEKLKNNVDLNGKPLLVFLNKKDAVGCLSEMDLALQINFQEISVDLNSVIRVEAVSAISGYGKATDQGIVAGFRYVLDYLEENYEGIDDGVRKAMKVLEERRKREKEERQMRLAEMEARESEPDDVNSEVVGNGTVPSAEEEGPKANGSVVRKKSAVSKNKVYELFQD